MSDHDKWVSLSTLADINPPLPGMQLSTDSLVSFIPMSDVSDKGHWTTRQTRKVAEVMFCFSSPATVRRARRNRNCLQRTCLSHRTRRRILQQAVATEEGTDGRPADGESMGRYGEGDGNVTVLEAVAKVLAEAGEPLHCRVLAQRMLDQGMWHTTGKTPSDTVSAALAMDLKAHGTSSTFVRTGPNTYGLRQPDEASAGEQQNQMKIAQLETVAAGQPMTEKSTLSFTDAAEQVLVLYSNRQPMHYRDITDKAVEHRLLSTKGKTPESSMYAQILTEIDRQTKRGEIPRFVKHGKGIVGLSRWSETGLAGQIQQHNAKIRRQLLDRLHQMPPYEFELLIGDLLGKLGFTDVEVTTRSGDGGIDVRGTLVVGEVIRTRMAVQVKRWKSNVQSPTVQQVRGSLGAHDQGLIITTSDYSKGAREEAARTDTTPVALMNGEQLVGLLFEHGTGVRRTPHDLFELATSDEE